jgi:hypothetical protein
MDEPTLLAALQRHWEYAATDQEIEAMSNQIRARAARHSSCPYCCGAAEPIAPAPNLRRSPWA